MVAGREGREGSVCAVILEALSTNKAKLRTQGGPQEVWTSTRPPTDSTDRTPDFCQSPVQTYHLEGPSAPITHLPAAPHWRVHIVLVAVDVALHNTRPRRVNLPRVASESFHMAEQVSTEIPSSSMSILSSTC